MFAVIRVQGRAHIRGDIAYTLKLLKVTRINHLALVPEEEPKIAMLKKAEPYITWGEITKETLAKLIEKRGRLIGDKRLDGEFLKKNKMKDFGAFAEEVLKDAKKLNEFEVKPVFRLSPPKKGYERKGIKKSYSVGGVSGYRKEKINALIEKMM